MVNQFKVHIIHLCIFKSSSFSKVHNFHYRTHFYSPDNSSRPACSHQSLTSSRTVVIINENFLPWSLRSPVRMAEPSNSSNVFTKKIQEIVQSKTDLSHEQLVGIETRRRSILQRGGLPFWRILLFWEGTVLRLLLRDSFFWLVLIVYIAIRIQARYGTPDLVKEFKV